MTLTNSIKKVLSLQGKNIVSQTVNEFKTYQATLQDTALLLKLLPQRLRAGFLIFISDFLLEMEQMPDKKERLVYSMKVLAALSKLAFSSAYDLGLIGPPKLLGFGKVTRAPARIILSKVLYRSIQEFLIRFIEQLEKEELDATELKNLQTFKKIILDDAGNAIDKFFSGIIDPQDRAFNSVERFKNFIFTGELLDR
jgi:hypothetical protein